MPRCTPRPRPWTTRTSSKPAAEAASMYSETTNGMSRGANGCRSSSGPIGMRVGKRQKTEDRLRLPVFSRDDRLHPAADREVADHGHAARVDRRDQVVEDLVGHRLVEDPSVAEVDQ